MDQCLPCFGSYFQVLDKERHEILHYLISHSVHNLIKKYMHAKVQVFTFGLNMHINTYKIKITLLSVPKLVCMFFMFLIRVVIINTY